ncbi:MAG: hypothetical protein LBR88_00950 [Zoogloeaceae bacterium]|jgi:tetratricopeptide (TPR) repeat protein|nr:hypothetical protein [Zoogloeaceae bacterium]
MKRRGVLFWGSLLSGVFLPCLIVLIYVPGLSGGFLFDDSVNILENSLLSMPSLSWEHVRAAAWSGHAGPLGRPVSVLSFALNNYFLGSAPYGFKLVNLALHVLNTLLVGALAHVVLRVLLSNPAALSRKEGEVSGQGACVWGALLAAALWGLNPLNLTSVLYVVQRMTSLSALFGWAALLLYGSWRISMTRCTWRQNACVALVLPALLILSVLSKESGALFVPLLIFMELTLFKGEKNGQALLLGPFPLRRLCQAAILAGIALALWKLPSLLRPENFYHRNFTGLERIMTEARVLFYYLRLFFFPSLSELALYHDDFVVSKGILEPVSTMLSLGGLLLLTGIAWWKRKTCPAFCFAWGWFLIAHMLESTVISLELVHEHRNYVATFGFVVLIPALLTRMKGHFLRPARLLVLGFLLLSAFVTWQRAQIWGDPLEHAMFEAKSHPDSERANYQLGQIYLNIFAKTQNPKYRDWALEQMEKAMQSYQPGNAPLFGMLTQLSSSGSDAVAQERLVQLKKNLREGRPQISDYSFLASLADCRMSDVCQIPELEIVFLFAAAIENPKVNNRSRALMYSKLATYYLERFKDLEKAEECLRMAVSLDEDANYHLLLVELYLGTGRKEEARAHLDAAIRLDAHRRWHQRIARFQKTLETQETK